MIILAADVGGTKSNLGLFESGPGGRGGLDMHFERSYPTHDFPQGLHLMLRQFLEEAGRPASTMAAACVGIAGPVEDGVCVAEWLPWNRVDENDVSSGIGVRGTRLINDMVATAWGVTALKPEQLVTLNEGEKKDGRNVAVIAAGTGLGESALIFDDGKFHAVTCE